MAAQKIPLTKDHWLWGARKEIMVNMAEYMHQKRLVHGDIFKINGRFITPIVVTNPAIAQYILQKNHKNYVKSRGYQIMRRFLGNGLLTNEGDSWLHQRRLIQPGFRKQRLQNITKIMVEVADEFVERWAKFAQTGETFDVAHEMGLLTMDVVAKTLFSADISPEQMEKVRKAIEFLNTIGIKSIRQPWIILFQNIPLGDGKRYQDSLKVMNDTIYGIIEKRRKEGIQRHDLLDMLLDARDEETGEGMSDEQLRDEALILFVAGHETTANALAWIWYSLGMNPAVEQTLRDELAKGLAGKTPTFEDIPKLSYLSKVIQEGMRLYPPAWVVGRLTKEDDVAEGFLIPKDSNVLMAIREIHRHPDYWDEPEKFMPERFAPENMRAKAKFAYFPFGGGPRLCIGNHFALMEMTIVLAALLQNYNFSIEEPQHPEIEYAITLKPKNGIKMRIWEN